MNWREVYFCVFLAVAALLTTCHSRSAESPITSQNSYGLYS